MNATGFELIERLEQPHLRPLAYLVQGIFIDPKRKLVIASNANWSRASLGPEKEEREQFYKRIQALIDAEG